MPVSASRITRVISSPLQMGRLARTTAMCGLIAGSAACAESTPVAPDSTQNEPAAVAAPTPVTSAPTFNAPTGPAHIYQETGNLYASLSSMHIVLKSRYVLYDDGTFSLQFASSKYGPFDYAGKYVKTPTEIRLLFNDSNLAGPWDAIATPDGNRMRVAYNWIMVYADFENGEYVEASPTP